LVIASVRSGGWTASGFAFAAAQRMIGDGTVAELARLKRLDARARQKLAVDRLSGFEIQTNGKCYHLWLTLPAHWRSQTFVAAAARRNIALTPSTTFAAAPGHAPNAVRLALAAPTMDQLDRGLRTLAPMLNAGENDFDPTSLIPSVCFFALARSAFHELEASPPVPPARYTFPPAFKDDELATLLPCWSLRRRRACQEE
jgi:hypothetical protein